ncbi:unnamed protein product [Acanthoscelides obtectus]|uniref:Uncharacterized protein n=1 Tax=Acanthoscelides obtectus TaxID=200917 RepID=A0A9P0L453_ACAOB|nr:unnamed protein product [Acanthoscelides obtectus]CAK1638522.1 hypothetical protein AOBTE_LOCUS10645 [Acanthoscelides obtectus]
MPKQKQRKSRKRSRGEPSSSSTTSSSSGSSSNSAINDVNITSAVEAANIRNPHILAAYLKNKTYTGRGKPLKSEVQQSINQSGRLGASDNIVRSNDKLIFKIKDKKPQWLQNVKTGVLSEQDNKTLQDILIQYQGCIFLNLNNLGKAHSVSLKIELVNDKPVTHKAYRLAEIEKQIMRDVRDERDVRMAVQSHSMSVAADRQIDGGWGKMTRRQDANALNRFNAAQ